MLRGFLDSLLSLDFKDVTWNTAAELQAGDATSSTRGLCTMNWSRKGALLMLAVVVFWAASPASACLLNNGHPGQLDCCRAMAPGCDLPGMTASSSCCQFQRTPASVLPAPPASTEHGQTLALVTHPAALEMPAGDGAAHGNTLQLPPPKFPPGGAFALRI